MSIPLIQSLIQRKMTFATCESMTGGELASIITDVPSVSTVYRGGYIVYSNEAKIQMTGLNQELLEKFSSVSLETSNELAKLTRTQLDVDFAVAIVGNAGPMPSENQPVGAVFISVATKHKVLSESVFLKGSRKEIKKQACQLAFELITRATV